MRFERYKYATVASSHREQTQDAPLDLPQTNCRISWVY